MKISLCMIVKNEEKVIDRCLSSVAHLVDEVIVADTGSTDRTKEIVRQYTTSIYDFNWVEDFSAARNFAASKATGEWILVLDADEYVDEENFKLFREELERDEEKYDMYAAKILNFSGTYGESLIQNHHDRIYKNNKKIKYYRAIHEQLKEIDGKKLNSMIADLLIFHSGYLNKTVQEKGKSDRNRALLDKEMKESKNAFDYFNLGNEYLAIGEHVKALDAYIKAYSNKKDFRLSWVSTTVVQIISVLIHLKRYSDAFNVIIDAESLYPNASDIAFLKGEVCYLRGQLDDAKYYFQHMIENPEKYGHIILRSDAKDLMPHKRLGDIFLYEEIFDKAIYHYVSVLNINKQDHYSINKVIHILNKFHNVDEIVPFLRDNHLVTEKNQHFYLQACFEVGMPRLILPFISSKNETLKEITLFKDFCIHGEGNIEQFKHILNMKVIKELKQKNLVNLIDLYLFYKSNNTVMITKFLNELEQDDNFNDIAKLLENRYTKDKIDDKLFLGSIWILLNYKKNSLVSNMLNHLHLLQEIHVPKIAAMLFLNGFKVEALQVYDKSNWGYFTEQDLLNIIQSLLETDHSVGANEFMQYALMTYPDDFRFYKIILDSHIDDGLFSQVLTNAKEKFHNSVNMKQYI